MMVRLEVLFEPPTDEDMESMKEAATELTHRPQSVRVFPREDKADWLIAEFEMPTEAQYAAVEKVDAALRFYVQGRMDSCIQFPKSEKERPRRRSRQ